MPGVVALTFSQGLSIRQCHEHGFHLGAGQATVVTVEMLTEASFFKPPHGIVLVGQNYDVTDAAQESL